MIRSNELINQSSTNWPVSWKMTHYSRSKLSDLYLCPRVDCLKTIPFTAAHTFIAHIWQFPSPSLPGGVRPWSGAVHCKITAIGTDRLPANYMWRDKNPSCFCFCIIIVFTCNWHFGCSCLQYSHSIIFHSHSFVKCCSRAFLSIIIWQFSLVQEISLKGHVSRWTCSKQ